MPDLTNILTVQDLHDRTAVPLWHTVCGRRLHQMTFGHARLLEAMNLWSPEEPLSVLLAVFVCSRSALKARRQFDSRRLKWRLGWWLRRLGRTWDWGVSRAMFARYIAYHMAEPYAVPKPPPSVGGKTTAGGTRPVNTPWLTHLRATLCARCGYSPESFDDQPFGQLILDYYAIKEIDDEMVLARITRAEKLARDEALREQVTP